MSAAGYMILLQHWVDEWKRVRNILQQTLSWESWEEDRFLNLGGDGGRPLGQAGDRLKQSGWKFVSMFQPGFEQCYADPPPNFVFRSQPGPAAVIMT